jgi:hypothetical protein
MLEITCTQKEKDRFVGRIKYWTGLECIFKIDNVFPDFHKKNCPNCEKCLLEDGIKWTIKS